MDRLDDVIIRRFGLPPGWENCEHLIVDGQVFTRNEILGLMATALAADGRAQLEAATNQADDG